jgi:hypothetical protein
MVDVRARSRECGRRCTDVVELLACRANNVRDGEEQQPVAVGRRGHQCVVPVGERRARRGERLAVRHVLTALERGRERRVEGDRGQLDTFVERDVRGVILRVPLRAAVRNTEGDGDLVRLGIEEPCACLTGAAAANAVAAPRAPVLVMMDEVHAAVRGRGARELGPPRAVYRVVLPEEHIDGWCVVFCEAILAKD